MAAGDPVESREALERAASMDSRDPRVTVHLGLWYAAAVHAIGKTGDHVELPPLGATPDGPELSADVPRFAVIGDWLTFEALKQRSLQYFAQTLRFRLPRSDARFVRRQMSNVRDATISVHVAQRDTLLKAV
jgi:hypothetical protein